MDTRCIDLGTAATGYIYAAQEKCPHLLVLPDESRKFLKSDGTENDKGSGIQCAGKDARPLLKEFDK